MRQMQLFSDEVAESERPTLMISLVPQYWDMVLEGTKRFEYRRVFREDAVDAFIYASAPRMSVEGFIRFGVPIIDSPAEIAALAETQHAGSTARMLEYFGERTRVFAIPIIYYERINEVPLEVLRHEFGFSPPQSYVLLDRRLDLLRYLKGRRSSSFEANGR